MGIPGKLHPHVGVSYTHIVNRTHSSPKHGTFHRRFYGYSGTACWSGPMPASLPYLKCTFLPSLVEQAFPERQTAVHVRNEQGTADAGPRVSTGTTVTIATRSCLQVKGTLLASPLVHTIRCWCRVIRSSKVGREDGIVPRLC